MPGPYFTEIREVLFIHPLLIEVRLCPIRK